MRNNFDCYQEYYNTIYDKVSYRFGYIFIMPPSIPTTIIVHSKKLAFEEFLCYVASMISLWFGFSFIMLSDYYILIVNNVINYFVNKYSQISCIKCRDIKIGIKVCKCVYQR